MLSSSQGNSSAFLENIRTEVSSRIATQPPLSAFIVRSWIVSLFGLMLSTLRHFEIRASVNCIFTSVSSNAAVGADLTRCLLRLTILPSYPLDRLSRYEATLSH